jgi:hypothetical protein
MSEVNYENRIAVYRSGATVDLYRYISVIYFFTAGYAVVQLVKARHKKSKVRAFDYRWGHSNFLST